MDRGRLLADRSLTGAAWCRAYAEVIDTWLAALLEQATGGDVEGLALVAVGGFGRSELCPQSDIDVLLVHARKAEQIRTIADHVWYPVWDQGLHLGHKVCTTRQALGLAADDLDTATALLSSRHVAGDPAISEELAQAANAQWVSRFKRWLTELGARTALRHAKSGDVAFNLEPDLKEGRGGLRDVHGVSWAEAAQHILLDDDQAELGKATSVLLDARVELQRYTDRPSNVLALQYQQPVAAALGDKDADTLMARVARAARTIAWTSDDTWHRIRATSRGPLGRVSRRTRALPGHLELSDGEITLSADARPDQDPTLLLRAATAAAAHSTSIDRAALDRLAATAHPLPNPWPPEARETLVALLRTGTAAVSVIETLDQRGLWTRILPEWQPAQARPQRNPYHRFTVDRHLLEATANAARLAARVDRPDLLVIAALLHDLGKAYAGDHTERGMALARAITTRMGWNDDEVDTVVALIEHHLLLPDVATRRDLDDPTTIDRVARAVATSSRLHLLAALTEADSLATGSSAWGPWKAHLVAQLVGRVSAVLEGTPAGRVVDETFPSAHQLALLADGGRYIQTTGDTLTVSTDDRPGIFNRVAGVLALHGLEVLSAAAHSTESGRALAQFRVTDPGRIDVPWDRVTRDLQLALDGRLALQARLAERAHTYARRRSEPVEDPATTVSFDDDASSNATVVDVHTADAIGVLYRITRAMAELDLDIRSAKVQTLGTRVVDAFYVRDGQGAKIVDAHTRAEIQRAILHSLSRPTTG